MNIKEFCIEDCNLVDSFHLLELFLFDQFQSSRKCSLDGWGYKEGASTGATWIMSFYWNNFIPMEWFHSNGMISFQWNDFIPMEWFYSNGMILFQWNDSALKKKPYKGQNLKILEWILDRFYYNGTFTWLQWLNWNIEEFCIEDCNLAVIFHWLELFIFD